MISKTSKYVGGKKTLDLWCFVIVFPQIRPISARKSGFWPFSRKVRQKSVVNPSKSAVVTKGLKIRVKTHFVRMASLQRISSARKVFQNPGAVVRMMSNDTGRSEGKFFDTSTHLRKWHDNSLFFLNFRSCQGSRWCFRKEREGSGRPVL